MGKLIRWPDGAEVEEPEPQTHDWCGELTCAECTERLRAWFQRAKEEEGNDTEHST